MTTLIHLLMIIITRNMARRNSYIVLISVIYEHNELDFFLLNVASANINKIAVVTFLLKMSSKEERLSRRTARDRSSNGKRTQRRTSAHVLPRLFRSARRPASISRGYPRVLVTFGYHSEHISRSSRTISNTHGCMNVSERNVWRNASQRGQGCHIAALHLEGEFFFFNKTRQKEYEK